MVMEFRSRVQLSRSTHTIGPNLNGPIRTPPPPSTVRSVLVGVLRLALTFFVSSPVVTVSNQIVESLLPMTWISALSSRNPRLADNNGMHRSGGRGVFSWFPRLAGPRPVMPDVIRLSNASYNLMESSDVPPIDASVRSSDRTKATRLDVDLPDPSTALLLIQAFACIWALTVIPDIMSGILTSFCGTCKGPTIFAMTLRNPLLAFASAWVTGWFWFRGVSLLWLSRLLTLVLLSIALSPFIARFMADCLHSNQW